MGKRPQEGNIAWKTSRLMTQCKKGNVNRRRCNVVRKDGTRCNGIAVTGFSRCFHHGGSGVLARRGLYKRKLRYRAWTESKAEIEQHEREHKERFAEFFDFPQGKE
jgi:hypothetical protein